MVYNLEITGDYQKIAVTNSLGDDGIIQKMYNIRVFSKSRELNLLQKLSEKRDKYYDVEIIDKLFNHYKICNGENVNNDLYLKNKYLYLTTRGVMNYLRLYQKQKEEVNKPYYDFEISRVKNYIKTYLKDNDSLSIVSLGAANSDKEKDVFKGLTDTEIGKIKYCPVDISNYLIHLGIIDVSSEERLKDLDVNSIIADFWDLGDYIEDNEDNDIKEELFGKKGRVFLLLGGTFGNYTEKEFLDKIVELMDVGDELIISLKLKKEGTSISEEYDHPGDSEFLMEPLTYIPYFYGYAKYHRDLLEKGKNAELKDNDYDKKFVSIIPKSECHAPFIEVKDENELNKKLRLAWTTRYDKDTLINWLKNYRSNDNNIGDFILKISTEEIEGNHALIFLRKDRYDYGKELLDILNGYGKAPEYQKLIEKMDLEKKFNYFYDYRETLTNDL